MTFEEVRALLESSGADAWELTEERRHVREFYFIRRKLDQHRLREVREFRIKVYRLFDDGKYLGSAGGSLSPTADRAETEALLQNWLKAAAFVRNPAYTLVPPEEGAGEKTSVSSVDTAKLAADFLSVMRALPETETEDINSFELFTGEYETRFANSRGVDRKESGPRAALEVVLNARDGGHEIELYRMITAGGCDRETLSRSLARALSLAKDRLQAGPTPALKKCDVLFSTEVALPLYEYFADRLDAAYKVRGYSDWEIGKPIAEDAKGDRVTLHSVPFLPNSSENSAFDAEGATIHETLMMENGVPRHFLGSRQFSCYLGLADSFRPGNLSFSGGTHTEEQLRTGAYLEAVEFSDFQVNPVTGDIAGEIRLAYWHDGAAVTPVTGGSVSGNMADFLKDFRMSRETMQIDSCVIPAFTRLPGVSIAGVSAADKEVSHV